MANLDRYRMTVRYKGLHGLSEIGFKKRDILLEDLFPTADKVVLSMAGSFHKLDEAAALMYEVPDLRFGVAESDHLLELAGETGTHSILDVTHLAARPEFAAAAPMLASDLRTIFGTDRPTREQAEDAAIDIGEELQGQAYYFAVYKDGQLSEYAFIGSSGA